MFFDGAHIYTTDTNSYAIFGLEAASLHTASVRAKKGAEVIEESPVVEAYVGNGTRKATNPGTLTIRKKAVKLKLGRTRSVRGSVKPAVKRWRLTKQGKALRYISDDPSVATVTSKGRVKAVGDGECLIYVLTDNGIWEAVTVTVDAGPTRVAIKSRLRTLGVGETVKLDVRLTPANAVAKLTWTSDRPGVVSVDQDGNVTGVGDGTARVTVTASNGRKASKRIKVVTNPTKIALSGKKKMSAGETQTLTVKLTPANTDTTLKWESSAPAVASVTDKGEVTAVTPGRAAVTVTAANGRSAKLNITVK